MTYHLTYDFGSGSVKAALSSQGFKLCGIENAPYATYFPKFGWAEQKPEEHWNAMCQATKALKKQKWIPRILQVSRSHRRRPQLFSTDVDGRPLTDCVMWMDGRAEAQAEKINERLKEKRFSGKNVISKLCGFWKKAGYGHARTCDAGCLSISLSQDDG